MTTLLRLYPAAYRREFGDEIAYAYHEATRGAGAPARVREGADVAGHALRMRLGLGSTGRPGRLLAALAPFALVAIGACAAGWMGLMRYALFGGGPVGAGFVLLAAGYLVMLFGAFLALAGRWSAGSWTVLAGVVVELVATTIRMGIGGIGIQALSSTPMLVLGPVLPLALVAVACPPDLRPAPRIRTRAGVAAVLAWTLVLAGAVLTVPLVYPLTWLRFVVPVAAGLLLAGRPAFARLRTAPAVLLAGLPFLYFGATPGSLPPLTLAGLLILLPVTAVVVSVRRRRGARDPLVGG
ncbi:hypothetical protein OHA37_25270 [Streptomyces sp. NBC_00335]|uniref:hypothetical protein n=1 Tax=unclassified Streptomyces TaxID=2593676 RepID=UPI00225036E5|nr:MULTISPECIES: hypothetical protein [unclassified Streptomyces]MCX5407165.1 hypothetical protein [Streptomyces sp. NBC_00086]